VAELLGGGTEPSDLSGSLIQASNPIQVITALPCLDVPDTAEACDHVEESNLPAETLGEDYVVARPTGPLANAVGQLVRIYGNFDGTTLTYSPSTPTGCPTTINAGDVVTCGVINSDFEVKGNNSFAVGIFTQGASVVDPATQPPNQQGDPDQSMISAVKQYRTSYIFLAPTDYTNNYAVVVGPTGTTLTLDGSPVTATPTAVGSTGYEITRIKLEAGNNN
jgi:IgGFc binding protein